MKENDILHHNFFMDQKKLELTKKQRANIIQAYLLKHKLSIRAYAKQFDISRSTVEDWLLWNRINDEQIKILKSKGGTESEIYRLLRKHKKTEINEIVTLPNIDLKILELNTLLRKRTDYLITSTNTTTLLKDLINNANYAIFKLDKTKTHKKTIIE